MGTNVISGSATCVAVAIGNDTMFGTMAKSIMRPKIKTGFEKEAIIKSSVIKEGQIVDEHLYSIRKK